MIILQRPHALTDSNCINIVDCHRGIIDRLLYVGQKWSIQSSPCITFESANKAFNAYAELHGIPLKAAYLIHDELNDTVQISDNANLYGNWIEIIKPVFHPASYLVNHPFAFVNPDLVLIDIENEVIHPIKNGHLFGV